MDKENKYDTWRRKNRKTNQQRNSHNLPNVFLRVKGNGKVGFILSTLNNFCGNVAKSQTMPVFDSIYVNVCNLRLGYLNTALSLTKKAHTNSKRYFKIEGQITFH